MRSLSAQLLLLTVAFVMLSEVLIFSPSVARFRIDWLQARLDAGQLAVLAIEEVPDNMVSPQLARELLSRVGAQGIVAHRPSGIKLMVGEEILLLHVQRKKGLIDPVHKHMDHESMGYLISGKLRLIIGGKEFIATPGTSWVHPVGVEHFSEALEDCEQIEIKSPPRKTWVSED